MLLVLKISDVVESVSTVEIGVDLVELSTLVAL